MYLCVKVEKSVTFCFIHPLTESNHCSTCLGKSHWTKIEELNNIFCYLWDLIEGFVISVVVDTWRRARFSTFHRVQCKYCASPSGQEEDEDKVEWTEVWQADQIVLNLFIDPIVEFTIVNVSLEGYNFNCSQSRDFIGFLSFRLSIQFWYFLVPRNKTHHDATRRTSQLTFALLMAKQSGARPKSDTEKNSVV